MSSNAPNTTDLSNLSTYRPDSVEALVKGLTTQAATAAASAWSALEQDIQSHLNTIAQSTLDTAAALADGSITEQQAEVTFGLLQTDLKSVLLEGEVVPFIVGQKILDSVFSVVTAVVKNYTGITLTLGA